ncbi:Uu.00g019970.m01.CDS01 [Anthostomella pinea]|uniref:Uu.00g019970.m01.CDS01 n=1 Tax=Anthostomella pinea TaxID=933095 RepID=A0AAI8YQQ8_9PEZI|nr:Uu.00g019970.m01.CDS01 [Anthostomella pinea]
MAIFPFPWRAMTAIAVITSYLLTSRQSDWSKGQFVGGFFATWFLQLFLWASWAVVLWPKFFSPLRRLPEPAGGSFFMGHFREIADKPTGIPMRRWVDTVPNNGLMRYQSMFNEERVLVTGSKALSEVLVTSNYDFQKPAALRFNIGRILGVGVLLAEGDEHKAQRKNLMPAFAFRHIKDLYPVFWSKSREVVQAMTNDIISSTSEPEPSSDPVKAQKSAIIEVGGWASRVTLDIIGIAGLGRDFGAIKDDNTELNQTYRSVFTPTRSARMLALVSIIVPEWFLARLPVKRNNDIAAAAQFIRSECHDMVQEKKQKMARKEPTGHDILSVALESGGFSDSDLVDQLMTFLAAGHETTATSMTWAIYMLSRFPKIQEKLRQEVREKLPSIDSDSDISSLDIDHMPYLNAVCNEVLRYYAPVPLTIREAARDTSIMGQKIPKGVRVILAPWATNFDKEQWGPDAHEFNPERWMPKSADDKRAASGGAASNYSFMTFLHGPRSCIGQSFAKAEFACLLASWVGRFEFSLANEEEMDEKKIEIKGGITARPAKGMHVHATVVDGW